VWRSLVAQLLWEQKVQGSNPCTPTKFIENKKRRKYMYLVYWTEVQNDVFVAKSQDFSADQMAQALKYAESLRARRRAGAAICHITISAENPDSVGQAGVAETDSSYSWKKRRI
jgi:hypothetical protein